MSSEPDWTEERVFRGALEVELKDDGDITIDRESIWPALFDFQGPVDLRLRRLRDATEMQDEEDLA